jgi:cytochrome c-type biogenesis protein CcmH/NrfG
VSDPVGVVDVSQPADAMGRDERERLEREREFLLRSLDDLEREREKGAIDDESYARLHDDYTARAAAVIRALRDGAPAPPPAAPTSRRRRVLTALGLGAFGLVLALALAAALGARLPGQTSSGNSAATRDRAGTAASIPERIERLQDALARNPDDVGSRLLLARFLEASGDLAGALRQYDEVLARQPSSAEAMAQAGRILYLTARAAVRTDPDAVEGLVQQSRSRLDRAVALDPMYPDARFFRAIVLANEYGDFAGAKNDLQRYLVLAPDGSFADQARRLLADVTRALEGPGSGPRGTAEGDSGR